MNDFLNASLGDFLLWLLTLKMEMVILVALGIFMLALLLRSIFNPRYDDSEIIELLKQIRWNTAQNNKEQNTPAKPAPSETKPPINQQ
jgi:hypothetical protein